MTRCRGPGALARRPRDPVLSTGLLLLLWAVSFAAPTKPTFSGYASSVFQAHHATDTTQLTDRTPSGLFNLNSIVGYRGLSIEVRALFNTSYMRPSQQQNQFGLAPSWQWTKAYVGDFTPMLSENTLSYAPVRGAGVELSPGWFRFAFYGGQSAKTYSQADDYSYRRSLYAMKLGTRYLALNVVKGKDDTTSVSGTPAETALTRLQLRPQENLTAGLSSSFSITKLVCLDLEAVRSYHTSDLRSDAADSGIPSALYALYQPRCSTRVDDCLRGSVKLSLKQAVVDLTLSQLGPGFATMGVPYIKSDSRKARLCISSGAIPHCNANVSFEREADNLDHRKTGTTTSNVASLSGQYGPGSQAGLGFNYSLRQSSRASELAANRLSSLNHSLSLSPNASFKLFGLGNSSNLYVNYVAYSSRSGTYGFAYRTASLTLNHTVTLRVPVSLACALGQTRNYSPERVYGSGSYALTAEHQLLSNRWKNRLTLSYQPSYQGRTAGARAGCDCSFGRVGTLSLNGDISRFYTARADLKSCTLANVSLTYSVSFY